MTTAHIRFPEMQQKLGLGVGMDLPWGEPIGFMQDHARGDRPTDKVVQFLRRYHAQFSYLFLAYQPRSRGHLSAREYFPAYDVLFEAAAGIPGRAFHHTLLNLGGTERYERGPIFEFTNALVERYGMKWVVEDLGIWSLAGKSLPYPLPPFLTEEGLEATVRNVRECQAGLSVPLCVEFPGFTEGATFFLGAMDAYDFFRAVAEQTRSPVTIDVGHILSYQWLRGRTGPRLLEGLERLPTEYCFEIHLSGCQIVGNKFRDLHHGVLLDEQLTLLEHLLPRCPQLKAITFEDPKYDAEGVLIPKSLPNIQRLQALVARWLAGELADAAPASLSPSAPPHGAHARSSPL